MKFLNIFLISLFLLTPDMVLAQAIQNPLSGAGIDNLPQLINRIINILFVSVGLLAVLAIMIGGYQMIIGSRQGKEKEIQVGKNTIFWSLMGLVTVIFAYTIVQIVLNLIIKGDV